MKFTFDENALLEAVAPAIDRFEKDINGVLSKADGRSSEAVLRDLEKAARNNGIEPNRAQLRKLVEARKRS